MVLKGVVEGERQRSVMLLLLARREELGIASFSEGGGWWVEASRARCSNDGVGTISHYLYKIYFIKPWLVATIKQVQSLISR